MGRPPAFTDKGIPLAETMSDLLLELTKPDGDPSRLLSKIEGPFAIAICDHGQGIAYLMNDRFGGMPIYWTHEPGRMRWASEVKCLSEAGNGAQELNLNALSHFLDRGYVPPDQTYYSHVNQLRPFEIIKVAIGASDYQIIPLHDQASRAAPRLDGISLDDGISLFLGHARKALLRRLEVAASGPIFVTLSGGLDSRFLLTLAKEAGVDVRAVTYGQPDSAEVEIASEVARVLGVPHEIMPINEANWLEDRDRAVWMTDGMMDLTHTHIVHTAPALREAALVLDGLFGDVVLGRGAITVDPSLDESGNRYLRMNRFTYFGPRIEMNFVPVATPLIDTELVALMDALPSSLTAGGRLYREAAHALHSEVHRSVPWHKTGAPPYPYRSVRSGENWRKVHKRAMQALSWMGAPTGQRYVTMDYTRWCRGKAFMSLVKQAVYGPGGRLRQILPLPQYGSLFSPIPNARNAILQHEF